MVDFERSTPPTRIQHITKRKLLQLGMASALASGMLADVTDAQARITKIQILLRKRPSHSVDIHFPVSVSTR